MEGSLGRRFAAPQGKRREGRPMSAGTSCGSAFATMVVLCLLALFWATAAAAFSDADKCEAAKLKIACKYSYCRLNG
jgi:hypothetical protein